MGMYYGYHRRRRNRNNKSPKIALIILAFACMGSFVKILAESISLIITLAFLYAIIWVVVTAFRNHKRSIIKKCDEYLLTNSIALERIQEINARYNFHKVEKDYFEHSYDNEKMYENVSPKDYLIYQLVYCKKQTLSRISLANDNKAMLSNYVRDMRLVDNYGQFRAPTPKNISKYVHEREKELCSYEIKKPTTDFTATVILTLRRKNGRYVASKQGTYKSPEIEEIIDRMSYQSNGHYFDENIWSAICHVERAKVSNKIRFAIYTRDGNRCRKCGSTKNLEIDHIFPISKGGKSDFDNLQTLCHNCNMKKSNKVESGVVNSHSKRTAYICPNCNVELVMREGRLGKFYGCPNYPDCKFTKDL